MQFLAQLIYYFGLTICGIDAFILIINDLRWHKDHWKTLSNMIIIFTIGFLMVLLATVL